MCGNASGKIGIAGEGAVAVTLDDLMQVGRIGERGQRPRRLFSRGRVVREEHFQRRADLDLADADAQIREAVKERGRVLVADGDVAGVEADPQVLQQAALRLRLRNPKLCGQPRRSDRQEPRLVEVGQLAEGPQQAVRLRLDVEMNRDAPLLPQADQRGGNLNQVVDQEVPGRLVIRRRPSLYRRGGWWRGRPPSPAAGGRPESRSCAACRRRARDRASRAHARIP